MKIKHIILVYLIGFIFLFLGALLKILHYQFGPELLTIGTLIILLTGFLLIVKIITNDKFKDFLNW
jgi:uncharacterized membrane protein YjjP (DUF1212 family)